MRRALALLAAAGVIGAAPRDASALEPRFDHRDQLGGVLELQLGNDTVAVRDRASRSIAGPALRLAFGFDVSGEGDELVLGARVAWPRPDPAREHLRLALDARYRAYFGSEELKTFLDFGLLAPVVSRLAVGPLLGLGFQYDPSRAWGAFAGATLATGFGQARITSLAVTAGAQLRF